MKLFPISNNYMILMIIMILNKIFSKENKLISLNRLYEITLTIKGNENSNLLRPTSNIPLPNEILVNGNSQNPINYNVSNLNQYENTIIMRWSQPMTDCSYMFDEVTNIINIDISKFDTSNVINMQCMFCGLENLTSLDLSSLVTTSAKDMGGMFNGCHYLKSLNLSNFDTTQVTNFKLMFSGCSSLESLNLNNFVTQKVTDMLGMFQGCISLKSLDLSSFDTSEVTDFSYMFFYCTSLEYLNVNNFITSKATTMDEMFCGCYSLSSLNISSFDTSNVNNSDYMFYDCNSLKSLDLKNFDTSNLKTMREMFFGCSSLTSLDLSSFDTSEITDFYNMFCGCSSLKSLNLNNFQTSKATTMKQMFVECSSLTSLDLSSFDTSNVTDFSDMFYCCSSLESLNLNYFVTSQANTMYEMFYGCSSLLSLDLSTFNTSQVTNFEGMFANCTSLISLNLNSFNTLSCSNYTSMFEFCSSLISLDLSNFIIPSTSNKEHMFYQINENLVLCFDETKANIISDLSESNKNNCTCYQNSYKFFYEKNECIDSCSKDAIYQLEYENICYQNCPDGTHKLWNDNKCAPDLKCDIYCNYEYTGCIDEIPIGYYLNDTKRKTIDKCNIKCNECSLESVNMDLCISCNEGLYYFPKENETINTFKNCYNNEDGYYLDTNNKVFKPCYSTCKKCTEYGNDTNHKCTECFDNYTSLGPNCFKSCNKKIIEKNLCIDDCTQDNEYRLEYNNICYKSCPNGTIFISPNNSCVEYVKKESTETSDITESSEIMESTDKNTEAMELTDKNTETMELTDKNTEAMEYTDKNTETMESTDKNTETMESTDKNTESTDITYDTIYSESAKDSSEIIDEIEYYQKDRDQVIKKIEYYIEMGLMNHSLSNIINGEKKDVIIQNKDILYQITSTENQKNQKNKNNNVSTIDLGECENTLKRIYNISDSKPLIILKIDYYKQGLLIPIIGYDVFHPENNSKLNLDYCKNNIINLSIPVDIDEENLFKHDPKSDYYTDQCNPYTTINGTDILMSDRQNEFNDNKMSLCEKTCEFNDYKYDIKNVICECIIKKKQIEVSEVDNQTDILYYNFINIEESTNMASMKCLSTLFTKDGLKNNIGSYILLFIIFLFTTSSILFNKCGYPLIEAMIQEKIKKENKNKHKDSGEINIYKIKKVKGKKKSKKEMIKPKRSKSLKSKKSTKLTNKIKEMDSNNSKSISKLRVKDNKSLTLKSKKMNKNKSKKKKNNHKLKKTKNTFNMFNDYELNTMPYKQALIYDKRTFSQYYSSLIRKKHPILFSFYFIKDYNSNIIKVDLFFLSFSIYYFFNALFFDESTIHQIYEDGGIYNLFYLIPFTLYSFVFSHIFFVLIKYFSLTERNICKIKAYGKNNNVDNVKRQIIIKYIAFFTLSIMFLFFLWFYLSSFGAVYQNTQVHLIYNTMLSFGFSLLYPFIINCIPALFRINSLKNSKREIMYKSSYIIQYI